MTREKFEKIEEPTDDEIFEYLMQEDESDPWY